MRKSPRPTPALAATLALLLAASAPLDASASRGPQSQQQPRQSQQQTLPEDDDDDDERDDGATLPAPEATTPREIIIDAPPGARVDVHDRDGVIEVIIDESPSPSPSPPQPAPASAAALPATPAAPPATPAAPPLVDAPTQPPPAMVTVRLSAPERMNLERWVDGAWQRLCASPCQHLVPQGAALRVTPAAGKRSRAPASRVFHAPHDRSAIHLTVRPGDREQRAGGVGLALISAGGIASGLLMIDATARFEDRDRRSYEGFIVLGLASLTFLTGVAMAATGRTQVRELKSGRRLALIPGGAAF